MRYNAGTSKVGGEALESCGLSRCDRLRQRPAYGSVAMGPIDLAEKETWS